MYKRQGVDEGALLGDEGDAVDHTAQRFDLAFVHTGKGAYKIELHRVPVDAAIQIHDQAFVAAVGQTGHAVQNAHSRHTRHLTFARRKSSCFRTQ